MQGHFSVINRRGLITSCILIFLGILLFSISLAKLLAGASRLWVILLILAVIFAMISLLILRGVVTAGIDVENGQLIFANADGDGIRGPQFSLSELADISLYNENGIIEDPETACLIGARVVFSTESNEQYVYYPVSITKKQFFNLRTGLFQLKAMI